VGISTIHATACTSRSAICREEISTSCRSGAQRQTHASRRVGVKERHGCQTQKVSLAQSNEGQSEAHSLSERCCIGAGWSRLLPRSDNASSRAACAWASHPHRNRRASRSDFAASCAMGWPSCRIRVNAPGAHRDRCAWAGVAGGCPERHRALLPPICAGKPGGPRTFLGRTYVRIGSIREQLRSERHL